MVLVAVWDICYRIYCLWKIEKLRALISCKITLILKSLTELNCDNKPPTTSNFKTSGWETTVSYVTGFVKTNLNCTKTEVHFIAKHSTSTLVLPRNTKHMAIDGHSCFHRRPFAIPVKPPRCTTGYLGAVNVINKDVSGTRLLPTTTDLDLFCGLSLFLSLTEDTALLSVS